MTWDSGPVTGYTRGRGSVSERGPCPRTCGGGESFLSFVCTFEFSRVSKPALSGCGDWEWVWIVSAGRYGAVRLVAIV